MNFIELKSSLGLYNCPLLKTVWFGFSQRGGAKICVKHPVSFLGVLVGRAKRDSLGILKKSQRNALEKLKRSERRILKPTPSSLC